jgi:hypothetical protein
MSTLKADAVTSAQDNTALTLSGTGTGGVKVNDFFVQTKGADIASGTTLTLGKDGNQFDVTGTTTITGIATQGIGSYVTLHFDGILTFTHHSTNLILPGAANITTAAGDIAVMYEYASADWRCVSYTKASGAAVVPGGGLTVLAEVATTSGSSVALTTAIPSTATFVVINVIGVSGDSGSANPGIQLGDSGGLETSGYLTTFGRIVSTTPAIGDSTASFVLANHNATSDTTDGVYFLSLQDATNNVWCFQGLARGATTKIYYSMGSKALSAELDRITIITLNGDFDAGIASVSYM